MMIYCTLFNSGYLDKGLVMYESLKCVCDDFKLYVIAFDDKCYDVLCNYMCESLIPIRLDDFEDDRLLTAKTNRTEQEYSWTCSCHSIKYVLEKYQEPMCTYIDADMFFYSNPQILLDEIINAKADVGIIEHRLSNNIENRRVLKLSGRFCIEFNTFFNTTNGLEILNWWCDRCIEKCTAIPDGQYFGDQKYLDDWENRFEGVHVYKHKGAGVAPWNISQYRLDSFKNGDVYIRWGKKRQNVKLIFYHFQAMKYLTNDRVDVGINLYPGCAQKKLVDFLYTNYLNSIEKVRRQLTDKYGMEYLKAVKEPFNKKEYLLVDILGERNPILIIKKIWRLVIRKERDIYEIGGKG